MSNYEITGPGGRTVTLEGDTPPNEQELDQIFASVKDTPSFDLTGNGNGNSQSKQSPSGISAIPSDWDKEAQKGVDIWNSSQNPISKLWQTLGVVGETATKTAGRALETAKPVTDALMEGAAFAGRDNALNVSKESKAIQSLPQEQNSNPIIDPQAIKDKVQEFHDTYNQFKTDNPELANNLEAGMNILNGMLVGKVGEKAAPVIKTGIKSTVETAGNVTGDALINLDKMAGRLSEQFTGTSEEALRKAGTKEGRIALKDAANKQYDIGKNLVEMIDNADEYIPERQVVNDALKSMPPIDMQPVFDAIDKAKVLEASPTAKAANQRLENLKSIYKDLSTKTVKADVMGVTPDMANAGNKLQTYNPNALSKNKAKKIGTTSAEVQTPLSAIDYREVRKQLDNEIASSFDKDKGEHSIFEKQAQQIRNVMKQQLIKSAESSGNTAYTEAMKTWSDKLEKIDKLKSFLGKNSTTRENRVQSFVDNLFNRNKEEQQKALRDVSEIFGKDFVEKSKLSYLAKELGDNGTASWLPNWSTGKSLLGSELLGRAAGFAVGSPKIASTVTLPATRKLANIGNKLKKNKPRTTINEMAD